MLEYDSLGTVGFFRERQHVESAITARVLERLPSAELSYTPHPRSSTAGTTAWTIVRGLRVSSELLESPGAAVSHESPPELDTIIDEFHMLSGVIAEGVGRLSQQDWAEERTVMSNGAVILRQPLGQILWLFHFDAIHHRGQLSTYLRLLGARVPSIYGPSGDEPTHFEREHT